MNTHVLKTWPPYFQDIVSGAKTFEVRKDDRNFQVGDKLVLTEWDPVKQDYTERGLGAEISYKLPGGQFGIEEGYCVLGLKF